MTDCEQKGCSKTCINDNPSNEQFYCFKCDKELCAICVFEHKKNYSISGLSCDNELCRGSRNDNQ